MPLVLPSGVTLSDEDLAALEAGRAPHVAPAAAPEPVAPQANAFAVGQAVSYTWTDSYDGQQTRDGLVVELVADTGDGTGPKAVLALFNERTGNIPESQITAV